MEKFIKKASLLSNPTKGELIFFTSLDNEFISKRTKTILFKKKIKTVGDLMNYPPDDDITYINGIGKKSITELNNYLKSIGINWKEFSTEYNKEQTH